MTPHGDSLRLLLTRPAEECAALARTLAARGFFSSSLPLLAIHPLAENTEQRTRILALDTYQAVLVVSKAAARLGLALLDRYWPQAPVRQSWFTPGAASGQILRDYGLRTHWPHQGDTSEALLALPELAAVLDVPAAKALIIGAEGGRTLLADTLRAWGVAVESLILYRRVLPDYPDGLLLHRMQEERLNALHISSGQGLQHLVQLAGSDWPKLARLPLFVPGARVAELARRAGARQAVDCRGASSESLLAALHQYSYFSEGLAQ